jgi:hypothetical protein
MLFSIKRTWKSETLAYNKTPITFIILITAQI